MSPKSKKKSSESIGIRGLLTAADNIDYGFIGFQKVSLGFETMVEKMKPPNNDGFVHIHAV